MPLLNRNDFPPHGFPYREPKINWRAPDPMLPFVMIVQQIQQARANNPWAGLDPSYEACADALDAYVSADLHDDPRWCAVVTNASARALPAPAKRVGCSFCHNKRRHTVTA